MNERTSLQFRAELFNIFNNVNFRFPDNNLSCSNFGQIQAAEPGRVVQLAWKLLFYALYTPGVA